MNEEEQAKKKILFVITKSNWGGAQKYVYELSTALNKDIFTPIVALGGDGPLKKELELAGIETIKISGLSRDVSIFKDFFVFLSLFKIFKKINPAVVHLNSSKIGGLGSFTARLAGIKKIIFTAHGWAFNEREHRSSLSLGIIKFLSWLTIIFSHKVIVLSPKEKEQVSGWFRTKNKISVIENGIKEIDFEPKNQARYGIMSEYPALQKHNEKIWLGNIAELHPNKGLNYAIEAVSTIPNVIYIIIGNGELYNDLKNEIEEKNLEDKIFLVGQIENAARFIKAFDIFLFPSIKEGLPYTLLEAGFAGIPVVSSNVGGIPEIIEQQKTGLLVHPKQPKEIIRVINHLLKNPEELDLLGKNLETATKEKFSFEKMLNKTTELYY